MRGGRARWLWLRTARGLELEPSCAVVARGGSRQRSVVGGSLLLLLLTVARSVVHPLTRYSCGALGAARAELNLLSIEIFMNSYCLIVLS